MFLARQSVEIAENCEGFVASTKKKFERIHPQSEQNIQSKRIWIAVLISFLLLLNLFSGCSHLSPYYRGNFYPSKILFAEEKDLRIRLLSKEDSEREEAERRILAQIEVIKKSGARGFFIPGNHDWKRGLPGLLREENFVKQELGRDDVFFPMAGCPGPVKIDVENIRIIVMDTYFWLNSGINPEEGCPHRDLKASVSTLKTLLQTAGDRQVVFIAHIPLETHGPHGGFFDWRDHLFPFTRLVKWLWIPMPIIGSLYPLIRWNVVKYSQDLNSTASKNMSKQLKEAFAVRKPLIYAAGHDHSLQVLKAREAVEYILVSGAGSISKLSSVRHSDNTLFAHLHEGFMSVDFLKDGSVWIYVIEPGEHDVVFFKEFKTN